MKKRGLGTRLFSLLLTLALCLAALPLQVLAEEGPETGLAASQEGPAAPGDADGNDPYALEAVEAGKAAFLAAKANRHGSEFASGELANRLETIFYNGISGCVTPNLPAVGGRFSKSTEYTTTYAKHSGSSKDYQCQAYARAAYSYLFGCNQSRTDYRVEFKDASARNSLSYALFSQYGVRCGAYIRTTPSSTGAYNGSSGHSLIILGYDSNSITTLEGNYDGVGGVGILTCSWDSFNRNQLSGKGRYVCVFTQPISSIYDSLGNFPVGKPSAPIVSVGGQNVTLSWTYSGGASSFDAYLVQEPYHWEDIKYHISTTSAACTFSGVAPGEYCAFVIARPNPDTAQSDWTSLSVSPPHAHTWNSGYVSREPTFTSYGERTYACVDCGETRAESIPMLDSVTAQYSGNIRVTYHRSGLLEIKGTGEFSVLGYSCIDFSQSGFRMLNYLNQVTSVRIGEGITSVMGCVFGGMMNLESIDFPSSLTYIQDNLFDYDVGYFKLKSVYIPANVTQMADRWSSEDSPFTGNPFFHCKGLTAIEVSPLNPCFASQDGVLFYKDMRTLLAFPGGRAGAYTVPSGVDLIVDSAFSNCEGLTHASLPAGIREIGAYAFSHCAGLESISIPENVTAISYSAFAGCAKLASVSIPKNVKKIGTYAFENCPGLKDIYYGGTAAQWAAIAIRDGNEPLQNAVVHYAADSSGNTMGPNNELAWSQSGRTITVTGPVSAAEPLWAAAYDQNGRLLSVSPVTASGGSVSFPGGAASVRLIWTDPGRAPKCASVSVPLK